MPKPARYALIWSIEQEDYVACQEEQGSAIRLRENEQTWFDWLASRSSFSFQGKQGRLNLLKEARRRGREGYWYAYVRQGKRTVKHYAGRTSDLTITRLEMLATTSRTHTSESSPTSSTSRSFQSETALQHLQPLLTTRLCIPHLPTSLVTRERLLAALDAGLEGKLTLLSAPGRLRQNNAPGSMEPTPETAHRLAFAR